MTRNKLGGLVFHVLVILSVIGPGSWLWITRIRPWHELQDIEQRAREEVARIQQSLADVPPTYVELEREPLEEFLKRYPEQFSWHDLRTTVLAIARDQKLHITQLTRETGDPEADEFLAELELPGPLADVETGVSEAPPEGMPLEQTAQPLNLTVETVRVAGETRFQTLFLWLHEVRRARPGALVTDLEVRRLEHVPEWVPGNAPPESWPTLSFSLTLSVPWQKPVEPGEAEVRIEEESQ